MVIKTKKTLKKHYIVIAIVAICAFSFLPITMAKPPTQRPVEDWFHFVPHIFWWYTDEYNINPYQKVDAFGNIEMSPYWNHGYSGKVTERDMGDGWVEITAIIHGYDVPFIVYSPGWAPLVYGHMDYLLKYKYKIHVETWVNWMVANYWDDDGYYEDGRFILPPFPMALWDPYGVGAFVFDRNHLVHIGTGVTLTSFLEWGLGETVNLMANLVGMVKDGEYMRKVAFINVF